MPANPRLLLPHRREASRPSFATPRARPTVFRVHLPAMALAAGLLLAGCSSPEPAGTPTTCTVESFVHATLDLRVGQRLEWAWTADQELAFDVMQGETTLAAVDRSVAEEGSHTVQSAGLHELQWTNTADSNATLEYTLRVDGVGVQAACVDPTLA